MKTDRHGGPSSLGCPLGLDTSRLHAAVLDMYSRVARAPGGDFHFHRGPEYAKRALGYEASELARLPGRATGSFAGVGNPHAIAPIQPGETVLDIGCGSGTDLLIAARRVGGTGRALGVDMTSAMVEACREAAREAGFANVEVRLGDLHELPVADALLEVGLADVRIVEEFDPFEGTSKERTARKYGVRGVNVFGRKP